MVASKVLGAGIADGSEGLDVLGCGGCLASTVVRTKCTDLCFVIFPRFSGVGLLDDQSSSSPWRPQCQRRIRRSFAVGSLILSLPGGR